MATLKGRAFCFRSITCIECTNDLVNPLFTGYPKRGTLANSADTYQKLLIMISTACKTANFLNKYLKITQPDTPKIANGLVQYIGREILFSIQWINIHVCIISFVSVFQTHESVFQTQFLIQECTALLSKPNFISTLCYAIDCPLHHQKVNIVL